MMGTTLNYSTSSRPGAKMPSMQIDIQGDVDEVHLKSATPTATPT